MKSKEGGEPAARLREEKFMLEPGGKAPEEDVPDVIAHEFGDEELPCGTFNCTTYYDE